MAFNEGFLEFIVNVHWNTKKIQPWWTFYIDQQPYEWSSTSYDGTIGAAHWDVRGFPYCGPPYCTGEPFWTDYYPPPVPGTIFRLPRVGQAGSHGAMPNGAILPRFGFKNINEAAWDAYTNNPSSIGKVQWLIPPQKRFYFPGLGGGFQPNIWQIMQIEQPYHLDKFDPNHKIYDPPATQDDADALCSSFIKAWQATTDAYNGGEIGMDGSNSPAFEVEWRDADGRPFAVGINAQYPGPTADWKFPIPMVDGEVSVDGVIGNWSYNRNVMDWAAGLPPAGWWGGPTIYPPGNFGYREWAFHPAYASQIDGGKLDPKLWNTQGDTPSPTKDNYGPPNFYFL